MGEAIARQLKANNSDYIGLDMNPSSLTTHTGSITDQRLVDSLVKKVDFIVHTATLHKPHVATHSNRDFVDVNITGTLTLLEAARKANIKGFIYISTTSTFGDTLTPKPDEPAIWITEKTIGVPKNIYGVTKSAAEDLCQIFYRNHKLPCLVLKTSRFFPEEDDNKLIRENYEDLNIKATEYLYRRVDVEDVVTALLLAIDKVQEIGFGKYIISSTSPFGQQHLMELHTDAAAVVEKIFPEVKNVFVKKGWKLLPKIDRVYVNEKARRDLGWKPKYDFGYVLDCMAKGKDFRSRLSLDIGIKGYHAETFAEGPYPVQD